MEPDEIVGAKFRARRVEAGYVHVDHPDGAEVPCQDARETLQAITSLTKGRPTPILVGLREIRSASREARKTFANSAVPSRIALCVESPLSRTLANFFIRVSGPSAPTKPFTDLNDAQRWLLADP